MELAPFQRIVAFIAAVIVLVGVGAYLFLPSALGSAGAGPSQSGSAGPTGAGPGSPSGLPSSSPGGPVVPAQSPPDIYQWVPFSSAGLAAAAQVAVAFTGDYGTYSYQRDVNAYLAPMRPLISGQLSQLLGRAYAAPGVAADRIAKRQVSSGTAAILSLRTFGQSSLIFVVQLTQQITSGTGRSQQVTSYAVTLSGSGTSWQVSDIELASAGNN